ncbi:hypothetical protein [Klebsiella michiganensis]|uniref:hypothetical protein n=1 Tax=Klebsiella michiganensis TaxID=1134687 RepID=UPI0006678931|nr:hypothetical protein [Klebsiella michiganensis]
MDMIDFINQTYGGVRARFAKDAQVTPQQLTKWIKNNYIIINKVIYRPLRIIDLDNNEQTQRTNSKHAIDTFAEFFHSIKRGHSAFVQEYRKHKQSIKVNYSLESRFDGLCEAVNDAQRIVEEALIYTDHHSTSSRVIINIQNEPSNCEAEIIIENENPECYIQDAYKLFMVLVLRSKGYMAE